MTVQIRVAPSNSLIFISDTADFWPTYNVDATPIVANDKCISVVCLMWQDGETDVTLGLADALGAQTPTPDFDGSIETPSRKVMVSTVEHDVLLEHEVPETRTRVRIWLNRPQEPDEVLIGLG
ncbi:hypothetical protein [Azorhizobium sp. AG788]|uniref:hypothetical protein n=1 Tax=Azorhizobium sp. AG788 TaxID=2183897 RepID=UPI00313A3D41